MEKQFAKIEYSNYKCPECGARMVHRNGKYGEFLGCSTFPKCKGKLRTNGQSTIAHENWDDNDWQEYADYIGFDPYEFCD